MNLARFHTRTGRLLVATALAVTAVTVMSAQPASASAPHGATYESIRYSGGWSWFAQIGSNTAVSDVADAAMPDGSMHTLTLVPGSGVYDKIYAGSSWSATTQISTTGTISAIAAAALPNGVLHVETLVPGSGVYDKALSTSGTWTTTQISTNGSITAIAAAPMLDGTLHVETLVPGSGVYDKALSTSGTWTTTQISFNGSVDSVAAASTSLELHVFTLVKGSGVWDLTRTVSGGWASANQVSGNNDITSIAASGTLFSSAHLDLLTFVPEAGIYDRAYNGNTGTWAASAPKVDQDGSVIRMASASLTDGTLHLTTLNPRPASPARTNDLNKPVYFIHGFDFDIPAEPIDNYWGTMLDDFRSGTAPSGLQYGDEITFCYYAIFSDCTYNTGGDNDVPLITIARSLAWNIFNHYSQYGESVDIVAHSMGGLIARGAVTGVQTHDPSFPPYLFVEDAVTIETPNAGLVGAGYAACLADELLTSGAECTDMTSGSDYLTWAGPAPASTILTDWTYIGSDDDLVVPSSQSVPDAYLVGHKVIYNSGQLIPTIDAHFHILSADTGSYGYRYCDLNTGVNYCQSASSYTSVTYLNPSAMVREAIYYDSLY